LPGNRPRRQHSDADSLFDSGPRCSTGQPSAASTGSPPHGATSPEKRRQYFVELHRSGRWKYYYDSEDGIILRVREAAMLVEVWAVLAPPVEPVTAQHLHRRHGAAQPDLAPPPRAPMICA